MTRKRSNAIFVMVGDEQRRLIDELYERDGITIRELVTRAVSSYAGKLSVEERLHRLEVAVGVEGEL